MTEAEVQTLFNKSPLTSYAQSSPDRRHMAEVVAKLLWASLLAGPWEEEETGKAFKEKGFMADAHVQAVKDCYFQKMKPVVKDEQLAALRKWFGVKERKA